MGMPVSEFSRDKLMSRILVDLIHEGKVEHVADDLYIGGDDILSLFKTWDLSLVRYNKQDFRLSATKTVILTMSTTLLGREWSQGKLSASLNHVSSIVVCEIPKS